MTEKNMWNLSPEEALKACQTSEQGLTTEQAEKIRLEAGENMLKEGKKKSPFQVFLDQFKDLMVVILIGAAIISMFSGNEESTIVIFAVLVMNAVLGTIQHVKAEKSLESLKQLSAPAAKVIRDGIKQEMPAKDVVPGDILELEAGDMVAADGRILHNYSLQVNESSLTGESTNVDKQEMALEGEVALADRTNMVYSGSLVAYGRATVLVTATGMNTEIGKIAELMNSAQERKTPLQKSLDQFSEKLAVLIMIVCALVFALCMFRKMTLLDSLLFAVALAVAAIPEALTSIVTIVQAFGTQKMAKENAIIKKLKAVESLGCVSVICSDKTGTLTQNKMTVQQVYVDGKVINGIDMDITDQTQRYLLYDAVLTNDSSIVDGKGIGDPTEYALLEMFRNIQVLPESYLGKIGVHEDALRNVMCRMEEVPFDSDRKLMSTKYYIHGVPTILTKGAVDVLLDRCVNVRYSDGIRPMTEEEKKKIRLENQKFSENGLRVLAFSYKESEEVLCVDTECGYTFLGLISMVDPPRPESVKAVAEAAQAGIKTVMITGDHKVTATAIARHIGIFKDGDMALTGMELDALSDAELDEKIDKISVYARVSPENKIRIVDGWQRRGNIVSMTGDGVNDAPALKQADIGVAMGNTGTEVAKDASDMVLTDDNFSTIVSAVKNGRNLYRNILHAIEFLLSGNLGAILTVLTASLAGLPVPFAPVHLLFINLLTDSLPAIALGLEPHTDDVMKEHPRAATSSILTASFMKKIGLDGLVIGTATVCSYLTGLQQGNALLASTCAFGTLCLARLFHGFNCKSEKPVLFTKKMKNNKWLIGAFALGAVLITGVLTLPGLQNLFKVQTLTLAQLGIVYLYAFLSLPIIQLCKWIKNRKN